MKRILTFFLVVIVLAGLYGFFTVRRSFPQLNGQLEVSILDSEVVVHRDRYGIPHIYADRPADLFRAQGYVEAQDRFYQMDFWRHIGSARLSEMFGESQVETDMFLRTLGLVELTEEEIATMSAESLDILEWYAEGVNAYLDTHAAADISLEYAILPLQAPGYEPEPWEPLHTLTWAKMMSWDLSRNFRDEIARTILDAELGAERVAQLYPPYPENHPVIVPEGVGSAEAPTSPVTLSSSTLASLQRAVSAAKRVDALTGGGFEGIGSNNWVVDGSMTASGNALLANDPHLGIQMPSIWYEVGLHCNSPDDACPFDVSGFTFPGTPGVVIGHNARIAWGVTTQAVDTQDLYIERIDPSTGQYEVDGEWVDLEVRSETLQVAGGDDIVFDVLTTKHGPIISEVFGGAGDLNDLVGDGEQTAVALAWQTLEPSTLVEAILGINVASNWEEFRQAASLWDIAAQNLVYADVDGNIGYQSTGEIPVRGQGDGLRPVEGWDSANDWTGVVPFDEMPSIYNPERGFIVTANQPVTQPGVGPYMGPDAAFGYRGARIEELIAQTDRHTVATFQEIQMDSRDGGAADLVPHLLAVDSDSPAVAEMQDLIEQWSLGLEAFQAMPDEPGAAAYEATWRHVLRLAFHDDLPEDYWPEGGSRWFAIAANLAENPADPFWDDSRTTPVEGADDIFESAMLAAREELLDLLGSDSSNWSWSDLHTASFENQTLGQSGIAPIEWLFNRDAPNRVAGGPSIVNAVGWNAVAGYEVDWVPSMRMVVDLGDLNGSRAIHTTGQSGHAFHANYADMIELWTDGLYHPMPWLRAEVERLATDTLRLIPST